MSGNNDIIRGQTTLQHSNPRNHIDFDRLSSEIKTTMDIATEGKTGKEERRTEGSKKCGVSGSVLGGYVAYGMTLRFFHAGTTQVIIASILCRKRW